MDDLLEILIYIIIGIIGIIASAYKNKKKTSAPGRSSSPTGVPGTLTTDTNKDFPAELGPLFELFEVPAKPKEPEPYESIEYSNREEETNVVIDTATSSVEQEGMHLDTPRSELDTYSEPTPESLKEGQSDLQQKLEAGIREESDLENNSIRDDIMLGEITSVETSEIAGSRVAQETGFFDIRKAIIYSEILKRREF